MHTILSLRPSLAVQALRAWQDLADALVRRYEDRRRARRAHVTARQLDQLDDRALHDLGLSRSELLSAGAELHGLAERDRRVALFCTPLAR